MRRKIAALLAFTVLALGGIGYAASQAASSNCCGQCALGVNK